MLYRHKQGTFEICPYKATYTALVKQVVEDGTEIIDGEEITLYKQIEVEEQRECYVSDKELFERTLSNSSESWKSLVYEDVRLSDVQQLRYEQIRSLPEPSIGDCIEYVLNGTFPEGINHSLRPFQIEKENQRLGQELSEREINEIIQGIQMSDLEIRLLIGGL